MLFFSPRVAELKLRSVRFPLLGEYPDYFTGEDFVAWLNANVPGFDGNLDRAEDAARGLTERGNLHRHIGEFGNEFEKAFELGSETLCAEASSRVSSRQPDQALEPPRERRH